MKVCTLVYILDGEGRVLLGKKKRGFGIGKLNAPGGEVEKDEAPEVCAVRECHEEVGLELHEVEYGGYMDHYFAEEDVENLRIHVFLCRSFAGEPSESDEIAPEWFAVEDIPLDQMWDDDRYWLRNCLLGEKQYWSFWFENEKVVRGKWIPEEERLDLGLS